MRGEITATNIQFDSLQRNINDRDKAPLYSDYRSDPSRYMWTSPVSPLYCTKRYNVYPSPASIPTSYFMSVTGQLADTPTLGLPTRGLDSRQLACWTSRGLDNSRMPPVTLRAQFSFFWRHLRVHDLSSLLVDQCASCLVRELTSLRVGNPQVGISASCPVTLINSVLLKALAGSYASKLGLKSTTSKRHRQKELCIQWTSMCVLVGYDLVAVSAQISLYCIFLSLVFCCYQQVYCTFTDKFLFTQIYSSDELYNIFCTTSG